MTHTDAEAPEYLDSVEMAELAVRALAELLTLVRGEVPARIRRKLEAGKSACLID